MYSPVLAIAVLRLVRKSFRVFSRFISRVVFRFVFGFWGIRAVFSGFCECGMDSRIRKRILRGRTLLFCAAEKNSRDAHYL